MNRRDFLKLISMLSLAGALGCNTGDLMTTNRYGDMLREFYDGMKNDNLSSVRMDEIQRVFNELSAREDKYKSWLRQQDNKIGFENLALPFEPIYSNVLEQDTTSLVIPVAGNYHHLMIMGQARGNDPANQYVGGYLQFNADTSALNTNYSFVGVYGDSSMGGGPFFSAPTYRLYFTSMTAALTAASYSGQFVVFIPHYTSNYYKTMLALTTHRAGAVDSVSFLSGRWLDTSPINTVNIVVSSGMIEKGSLFSVYGIF
jgi:hypothetical protein